LPLLLLLPLSLFWPTLGWKARFVEQVARDFLGEEDRATAS
jgi:hypothetical protein